MVCRLQPPTPLRTGTSLPFILPTFPHLTLSCFISHSDNVIWSVNFLGKQYWATNIAPPCHHGHYNNGLFKLATLNCFYEYLSTVNGTL